MARQKAQQVHKQKTKIKHWQELLKQSNTTPPAQQFIFLKWNKTLYKAICPQEGPKAQVFILKNEPVLEINKCKKRLYIQYSSRKICTCITQKLLFLQSKWISGWDPGRCFSVWLGFFFLDELQKPLNDHVKWKCRLIQSHSFWCFWVSPSLLQTPQKSMPHQKAEGPVQVLSLFRHAGDAQVLTDRNS